jgi:threonine dehydratase
MLDRGVMRAFAHTTTPRGGFRHEQQQQQQQQRQGQRSGGSRVGNTRTASRGERGRRASARDGVRASVFAPFVRADVPRKELPLVDPEDLVLLEGEIGPVTRAEARDTDVAREAWYLRAILTADVYDVAVESPLERAPRMSERSGADIYLKREDLQPVFSFKIRGAYNRMKQLSKEELVRGAITASAGNHAQGVALSGQTLGCKAIIAMPVTTPAIKVEAVRRLGGTVELVGENFDATQAYAKKRAVDEGLTFIPPFDDPYVIAGQGTVGVELLRQLPEVEIIFVPIGGGGLAAGIVAYVKAIRPDVRVIGVEPAGANAMALSLARGEIVKLSKVDGFADGVAVREPGRDCFEIIQAMIDGIMTVKTDQIAAAIKDVFGDTRSILEPAGAVAVAGAKAYCQAHNFKGKVVAITSGANMNFDRLRVISEIADQGGKEEATLVSIIPETNGAFKKFVETVGQTNISEFKYRVQGPNARVLYSIEVSTLQDVQDTMTRMDALGFKTVDLSNDETTQFHLRHMTGGQGRVENEVLYKVEIPERAGALGNFLDFISPRWAITMTHYRSDGGRVGQVLFGVQVPEQERKDFEHCLDGCGYKYDNMSSSIAFKTLFG